MKHTKVTLAEWSSPDIEVVGNIDIDWPKIQKLIGVDHLEWILDQPKTKCQLVIEKIAENLALVVEFYDSKLEVEYHLRWAK